MINLLGLAQRAGQAVSGERAVRESVSRGRARLVLIAEDASPSLRQRYMEWCSSKGIPFIQYGTKQELGKALGKAWRSVVAITSEEMARGILAGNGTAECRRR